MKVLLDDRFAPITSTVGFLEAPLDRVTQVLRRWCITLQYHAIQDITAEVIATQVQDLLDDRSRPPSMLDPEVMAAAADPPDPEGRVNSVRLSEPFPEVLHRLEPLQMPGRGRELLIGTRSSWTAYFENSILGTDAFAPVGYLARVLECRGLIATCVPHTFNAEAQPPGRYGAIMFQLYGPEQTEWLNCVRAVVAMSDGGPWRFETTGKVQPYEHPERYTAKRVRDRFTAEMLEEYCAALGVHYFDPAFYGPESVLLEHRHRWKPGRVQTLAEVQRDLGLRE